MLTPELRQLFETLTDTSTPILEKPVDDRVKVAFAAGSCNGILTTVVAFLEALQPLFDEAEHAVEDTLTILEENM